MNAATKHPHCHSCWRANNEGADSSASSDYCKACTQAPGKAFPSMYIMQHAPLQGEGVTYGLAAAPAGESVKIQAKQTSDGSTANYYKLPSDATELQDLISFKNMNGQMAEIFRATYRYGQVEHSSNVRDLNKIIFYAEAELNRLSRYEPKDPA